MWRWGCCSSSGCPPRTPPSPTSRRPAGCSRPGCRSSWDRRRSRRCCGRPTCVGGAGRVPRSARPGRGAAHLAGPRRHRARSHCSAAPFGSADHVNYLAYGRILVRAATRGSRRRSRWAGGLDPVTSRVEAPWTTEPSVYGPFGTLLHGLSAWVGGSSLRQGVWVWQLLVVLVVARRAGPAAGRARRRPARPGRRALDAQPARRRHRRARGAHRRRRHGARAGRGRGGRAAAGVGRGGARRGARGPRRVDEVHLCRGGGRASSPPGGWSGHRSAALAPARRRARRGVRRRRRGAAPVGRAARLRPAAALALRPCRSATPWRPLLEWGRDTWGNGTDPRRDQRRGGAAGRAAGLVPAAAQPPRRPDFPARSRNLHVRTGTEPPRR